MNLNRQRPCLALALACQEQRLPVLERCRQKYEPPEQYGGTYEGTQERHAVCEFVLPEPRENMHEIKPGQPDTTPSKQHGRGVDRQRHLYTRSDRRRDFPMTDAKPGRDMYHLRAWLLNLSVDSISFLVSFPFLFRICHAILDIVRNVVDLPCIRSRTRS
jgi:hypothetical protein